MPKSLHSSRVRQSPSTKAQHAHNTEDNLFAHRLDSEDSQSLSSEGSLSDDSMSLKLTASHPQYPAELAGAEINTADWISERPINFLLLRNYLEQDRDDLTKDESEIAAYSKIVNQVANENEMVTTVLPHIFNTMATYQTEKLILAYNRRWQFQSIFSEEIGYPQPDLTVGLLFSRLSQDYPLVFNTAGELFGFLQPSKDLVLPLLSFEVKGPKGALGEACLHNRNTGACALKNVVKIKRAIGQAVKTYSRRIFPISIEITTESVQVTCHWMTTTRDGKDRYWSIGVLPPMSVHNLPEVQKLVRNALDWNKQMQQNLAKDFGLLEMRYRQYAQSPSEEIEFAIKSSETKKRARSVSEEPKASEKKRRGL